VGLSAVRRARMSRAELAQARMPLIGDRRAARSAGKKRPLGHHRAETAAPFDHHGWRGVERERDLLPGGEIHPSRFFCVVIKSAKEQPD